MIARCLRFPPVRALMGALAISFFSIPASLDGQEGRVLTLDEALDMAGEHDAAYRQALNNLGLNELDRRSAMSAFLPSLTVSASTNVSMTRQLVGTDDFGYPIENPINEWRTSSGSRALSAFSSIASMQVTSRGLCRAILGRAMSCAA